MKFKVFFVVTCVCGMLLCFAVANSFGTESEPEKRPWAYFPEIQHEFSPVLEILSSKTKAHYPWWWKRSIPPEGVRLSLIPDRSLPVERERSELRCIQGAMGVEG